MAEPSSFQVPPLRSIRSMRRICRKRRLRSDVANTLPWCRTATTGTDASSTKMSGRDTRRTVRRVAAGNKPGASDTAVFLPRMHSGLRANFSLPLHPL